MDKNELIEQLVLKKANILMQKYPGIINKNDIDDTITFFKDSPKEYQEIENEIDKMVQGRVDKYIETHSPKNDRDSLNFEQIRNAYEKLRKLLESNEVPLYVSGGAVPYLLLNQDSSRLHNDIDTICKIEDIEKLRKVIIEAGLYNPDWDSKTHAKDGNDYGFEFKIGDVPIGIYPFSHKEDGHVVQYSYSPYNHDCKIKEFELKDLGDYIQTYEGADGKSYDTMSLEYIKLTKDMSGREKDIVDSKKISEIGIREEVMNRIKPPIEKQRIKAENLLPLGDIIDRFKNNQDMEISYNIDGVPYHVKFLCADPKQGINIESIVMIPEGKMSNQICVEANNTSSGNTAELLNSGFSTAKQLAQNTKENPAPIIVPLIPECLNEPYYQQLSEGCFKLEPNNPNYRIDEQLIKIIDKTKHILKDDYGVRAKDKIFLNGYSSSGIFAQRFALIHPEMVGTACIGGASGTIPIPIMDIGYPIGIADFEKLFGRKFDMDNYKKIKFRYYVGELETAHLADDRFDDDGNKAPLHDLSFFDESVPKEVGKSQRELLGKDFFKRVEKTIYGLEKIGIDIKHTIIPGRSHNNYNLLTGVNKLGDKFISDTYRENVINKENVKIYVEDEL